MDNPRKPLGDVTDFPVLPLFGVNGFLTDFPYDDLSRMKKIPKTPRKPESEQDIWEKVTGLTQGELENPDFIKLVKGFRNLVFLDMEEKEVYIDRFKSLDYELFILASHAEYARYYGREYATKLVDSAIDMVEFELKEIKSSHIPLIQKDHGKISTEERHIIRDCIRKYIDNIGYDFDDDAVNEINSKLFSWSSSYNHSVDDAIAYIKRYIAKEVTFRKMFRKS